MKYTERIQQIQDSIGEKIQVSRSLIETAQTEKRQMSEAEAKTYKENDESINEMRSELGNLEKLAGHEAWAEETGNAQGDGHRSHIETPGKEERNEKREKYVQAFENYLRRGISYISVEERQLLQNNYRELDAEERTMSTGTGSEGGYTVPDEFQTNIIKTMDELSSVREAGVNVMTTSNGRSLPFATGDDTANKGEMLAENAEASRQDTSFGTTSLGSYTFSSKIIRVPNQLLTDSAINLEKYLTGIIGERLDRILDDYLTSGTGSSQPQGIVTGSAKGVDAVATNAITYGELLNLLLSVSKTYRKNGKYKFNTNTLAAIMQLKPAADAKPYFQPDSNGAIPDKILGKKYVINDDMDDLGTGNKPVLFGDMKSFTIRDIKGITLIRLVERYAEFNQVGFLAFSRHDSKMMRSNAIKHILMA